MIVVADTDDKKWAMYSFLLEHGVQIQRSEDFQAIGRLSRDDAGQPKLLGVVAYNGFCGNVCSMHIAGDGNWVSRDFIRKAFDYPFRQLNLVAILSPIAADNHRALKFDTHFGFKEVHRVKDGWADGVDLIVLELKKEDCKHLEIEDELQAA